MNCLSFDVGGSTVKYGVVDESFEVLEKNKILYLNGVLTNSISTTRSQNEAPIKFEDIYLRLDLVAHLKKLLL